MGNQESKREIDRQRDRHIHVPALARQKVASDCTGLLLFTNGIHQVQIISNIIGKIQTCSVEILDNSEIDQFVAMEALVQRQIPHSVISLAKR